MKKYVYVNVELQYDKIQELKNKTGTQTTKDALSVAVDHCVNCHLISEEERIGKKKRKGGRTPGTLHHLIEKATINE